MLRTFQMALVGLLDASSLLDASRSFVKKKYQFYDKTRHKAYITFTETSEAFDQNGKELRHYKRRLYQVQPTVKIQNRGLCRLSDSSAILQLIFQFRFRFMKGEQFLSH